jgi:alkanesulfonate monooxygenase SsuD/methylene tetrahydromethanopterin reductase-like flavin-dependent oxidoreductase (luciferase family)
VKTIYFHLMPYPELPADFQQKHRSVWVDIDPSLFDPNVGNRAYNAYIDQIEYAAGLGFDGIGVNEHHSNGYGMMPSPNLIASILARSCPDIAILILGDSVALYNPPIRVAEEIAMLDCISGGRIIAGFPVGSPMDTAFAYGQNPATLREKYYEGVDLIRAAWAADEPFAFNGNFTKLRYVNCWPRPIQRPSPPIWIPGGGSVETWSWCAEKNLPYLYLSYFGYKAAEQSMSGYWEAMREAGREPNPFAAGFVQFIGVGATEKEAYDLYREPAEYFFNRSLHVYAGFADPPGYKSVETVRAGVEGMVERAAREATQRKMAPVKQGSQSKLTFDEMVEKGYVVLGSPEQVVEKLKTIATDLNVGRLIALCQFGNMSSDLAKYNAELMATKVLPEIREMFESEWKDEWWITPSESRVRMAEGVPT